MIRPGSQLSAAQLNTMDEQARQSRSGFVPGLNTYQSPLGDVNDPVVPGLFIVKITSQSGNLYGFQEQYDPTGTATFIDDPQGIAETTSGKPLAAIGLSVGQLVVVRLNPYHPERYQLVSSALSNANADRYMGLCFTRVYGTITGARETWARADGSSYCRDVPDCPDGSCSVLWWCDGEGGVFSSPVGDRPGDAVGDPWGTEAEALGGCSRCPPTLNTTLTVTVPNYVGVTTGTATLTKDVDSVWKGGLTPGPWGTSGLYFHFTEACEFTWACDPAGPYFPLTYAGPTVFGPPFLSSGWSIPDYSVKCTGVFPPPDSFSNITIGE